MLLVSDVHGAFDDLAVLASLDEPLVVLGDLLNFVDYRTMDGLLAEVAGKGLVAKLADLRGRGLYEEAASRWGSFAAGRGDELRERFGVLIEESYTEAAAAIAGADAYVTYGNVDRPDVMKRLMSQAATFVDGDVVEIEGSRVGIVGGGVWVLGVPGEVKEEAMAAKLAALGPVDVLCTHVAPAVAPLSTDVIGGRVKESNAVLDYLLEYRPAYHYFGDIHQPQAITWRVADTVCRNVGYFRATGRAVRHPRRPPDLR